MGYNTIPFNPFPPSTDKKGGNVTPYELPIASANELGGVKVGSGLSINSETGVLSADNQIKNYSTTEQNTGTKWIDNNDIFERTFEISLGGSSDKDVLLISNLVPSFAYIKSSDFIFVTGSEQFHFYLGARVNGQLTTGFLLVKNGDLYIRLNNNYGAVENLGGYVTICYTKPTT